MVFYYYYDQLYKATGISLHITHEVIDTYSRAMHFAADRHHIYLQSCAQQGGDRQIGYYRMTQENIEQVIKDQPELGVASEENPKEKKEKEKDKGKEKENEPVKDKEEAKEKDKGKETIGEKRPSITDTGNSLRRREKAQSQHIK